MFALTVILGFLFVGANSQGSVNMAMNMDGTSSYSGNVPLVVNDKGRLSATAKVNLPSGDVSKGLSWDQNNGHGLSVSHTSTDFGSQLTGTGRLNVLNNDNHNLDVTAFATRNMPTKYPGVPNFNTVGGNMDYMFRDRVGASFTAAHTPFLQRTDLSAMGKLNLFKTPDARLDINAGLQRSMMPQFRQTQPFGGFSFTKFFRRR
ncbi:hypothetical protein ABMA27_009838 [Loxostege sticticalis]|uniref:Attacin C-terminal domain-containing protein n=1 Tax=Loxostege sticticalis TaxID=481309 RepID=A0ABR3H6M8_LOXSC